MASHRTNRVLQWCGSRDDTCHPIVLGFIFGLLIAGCAVGGLPALQVMAACMTTICVSRLVYARCRTSVVVKEWTGINSPGVGNCFCKWSDFNFPGVEYYFYNGLDFISTRGQISLLPGVGFYFFRGVGYHFSLGLDIYTTWCHILFLPVSDLVTFVWHWGSDIYTKWCQILLKQSVGFSYYRAGIPSCEKHVYL